MPEKPTTSHDNPRAITREVLSLANQGQVLEGLSPQIKAEVYGIMAYFIKKAVKNFQGWQERHPGEVLISNTKSDDDSLNIRTHVIPESEAVVTEQPKLSVATFNLFRVLHGAMHWHLKELANTYTPGPIVNAEDAAILDRLDTLLLEQRHRGGEFHHSENFLLSVAQPQARFIATTLFGSLLSYETQYGVLPIPGSPEFDAVMSEAKKAILRLSTMNLRDFGIYERKMRFFGGEIDSFILTPYNDVSYTTDESGRLRMEDMYTQNYKPTAGAQALEPTIGCPALFGRPDDGANAINVLTDYAVSLLRKSAFTETANYVDTRSKSDS